MRCSRASLTDVRNRKWTQSGLRRGEFVPKWPFHKDRSMSKGLDIALSNQYFTCCSLLFDCSSSYLRYKFRENSMLTNLINCERKKLGRFIRCEQKTQCVQWVVVKQQGYKPGIKKQGCKLFSLRQIQIQIQQISARIKKSKALNYSP